MFKKILLLIMLINTIFAQIKNIEIRGLKNVQESNISSLIDIKVGDTPSQKEISEQIKSLYSTGRFKDIKIKVEDDILIINLIEWPVINNITVSGNHAIEDKVLDNIKASLNLKPGYPYNLKVVQAFTGGLRSEYEAQGYLNVSITKNIVAKEEKVNLEIEVKEGPLTTYESIKFSGNKVFSVLKIRSVLNVATTNLLSYFLGTNVYSERKLDDSINQLKEFYYNNGYLNFEVVEKSVKLNEKKTRAALTMRIYEGKPFILKKISFSGPIQPNKTILKRAKHLEGQQFSKTKMNDLMNDYRDYLGDLGYPYANIQDGLEMNQAEHTLSFTIKSDPKKMYTIRHISIRGNTRTQTNFLRNFLYQSEGQRYSKHELDDSRARLMNLGFLDSVHYTLQPVPTYHDKVDVVYDVKERENVNSIVGQVGYGGGQGIVVGANLNFKNFFGTGNSVSLSGEHNKTTDSISFTHFDPFYLSSGLTRATKLYYTHVNSDSISATDYKSNNAGLGMTIGIPASKVDHINFGGNYEYMKLNDAPTLSSNVRSFIANHGENFNNTSARIGWSRSAYTDRLRYNQNVSVDVSFPLLRNDITYYAMDYSLRYHLKLMQLKNDNTIALEFKPHFAYGQGYKSFSGDLPFFKRYQAGGFGSVRNFKPFSLGPKDSKGDSTGGDLLTTLGTNLYFPIPFATSNPFKTALFFDVGNVYLSHFSASELRMSAGVMATAHVGGVPLAFSFGKNLSHKTGDQFNPIDFALGLDF